MYRYIFSILSLCMFQMYQQNKNTTEKTFGTLFKAVEIETLKKKKL